MTRFWVVVWVAAAATTARPAIGSVGLVPGGPSPVARAWRVPAPAQSGSVAAAPLRPSLEGSRTILYHARDLVALRAKVRYTTMIVLPEGEDILEATCGDKEFWIVNAHGAVASVKPAKVNTETNLTLLTVSGQIYAFRLTEVSASKEAGPDLTVYLEPDESAALAPVPHLPKYVPAEQLEDVRAELTLAKEDARRATHTADAKLDEGLTAFRTSYPLTLRFPYRFKADAAPFFIHAMFHDDHVTYIQAQARELPVLYELKDGAPNLVTFEVRQGTYVVPKVLDSGYFALGATRVAFLRHEAR